MDGQAPWLAELLMGVQEDSIQVGLLQTGRWLRDAPEGLPWIARVMRDLAVCLQKEDLPLSLRARALSAMAQSNDSGVPVLLRQFLDDPRPSLRQLAALGLGWLRDAKSCESLRPLVNDLSPGVSRAAMLALVAIGSKDSLETVAYTLLHGDESQRKAAAEALANDPEEGYPTLQEGSALDDTAVRRAVVFGLGRLGLPWAAEILERLATEDKQWVVQDAANQTLLLVQNPHPRLPRPLPPLAQTAWLIAFGGERGMGIAPGKPAFEMLRRVLQEGNDDQRLAALYFLGQSADPSMILPISQLYFASRGEIREAAFNALWTLSACGLPLPAPVQYGFA
jgi:HEAT repeat protein